jgi:hypothetical protein
MQTLKMKVVGFNPLDGILQIKFAGDTAEKSIDEYPAHQFNVQVENENVTLDDVLKALAQTGWNAALQQEIAEETARDNEAIALYTKLIGEEYDFTFQELFQQSACQVAENQPLSRGLMEV